MQQSLETNELTDVGDSKMAALETRHYIAQSQDYYLCPLPEKRVSKADLAELLAPVFFEENNRSPQSLLSTKTEWRLEQLRSLHKILDSLTSRRNEANWSKTGRQRFRILPSCFQNAWSHKPKALTQKIRYSQIWLKINAKLGRGSIYLRLFLA